MTDLIKTRSDGSIDTAHYMRRGRIARSHAARDMARTALPERSPRPGNARGWLLPVVALGLVALSLPYMV